MKQMRNVLLWVITQRVLAPVKMGQISFLETSVRNCYCLLHNDPKKTQFLLQCFICMYVRVAISRDDKHWCFIHLLYGFSLMVAKKGPKHVGYNNNM
jgi:hypothetical protein